METIIKAMTAELSQVTVKVMNLVQEMTETKIPVQLSHAKLHCQLFEDNSSVLKVAKVHKYRPQTKDLNCRLHHFRSYIGNGPGQVSINKINTLDQPADMLTKPLNETSLVKFRKIVMGW